ncbi:hypothetical protein COCON_G00062820 [Conger conger]|uniref:Uncharacterized protein n=1 Tax=Conger conger TaxID=82655 RepID=A0A9Q1I3L5_CONCO|nr:hypothetical protein COCON_G00062820 [Conger conger]
MSNYGFLYGYITQARRTCRRVQQGIWHNETEPVRMTQQSSKRFTKQTQMMPLSETHLEDQRPTVKVSEIICIHWYTDCCDSNIEKKNKQHKNIHK